MKLLNIPRLPEVPSLPIVGSRGRLLTLTTDNHVYHDTGSAWEDISAATAASINPSLRVLSSNYTIPVNSSLHFVSSLDDAGFTFDDAGAMFETG